MTDETQRFRHADPIDQVKQLAVESIADLGERSSVGVRARRIGPRRSPKAARGRQEPCSTIRASMAPTTSQSLYLAVTPKPSMRSGAASGRARAIGRRHSPRRGQAIWRRAWANRRGVQPRGR